jgi:phage-related protein
MDAGPAKKRVEWMGGSKDDLRSLPVEPKGVLTYGILMAQRGQRHPDATKLKDISATEVVEEIPSDYDTDTYRAVYTVLDDWVYVLHCFKKKSKSGKATPQPDVRRIKGRLKDAKELHKREGRDPSKGNRT